MSDDRSTAPATPDDQPPDQQQPVDGQDQQQTPPQPPPPAVDEPPRQDWRDRRLGEQQQRLRERNARIQELEAQLAQYNQGQPPQPQPQPQYGQQYQQQPAFPQQPGDIQRQINEAAARMATAQEFTRRCNEVAEGGRRQYQNFDSRVTRLVGLVDANDPAQVQRYNSFLEAAMNTGQASRLIYELGGDLDEASRIMALGPQGMQHELTRLSMRAGTQQSNAPAPINPVGSAAPSNRVGVQPDDPETADTITTEEWMRRREEQISTRRQRTLG